MKTLVSVTVFAAAIGLATAASASAPLVSTFGPAIAVVAPDIGVQEIGYRGGKKDGGWKKGGHEWKKGGHDWKPKTHHSWKPVKRPYCKVPVWGPVKLPKEPNGVETLQ